MMRLAENPLHSHSNYTTMVQKYVKIKVVLRKFQFFCEFARIFDE
jgi:hypothetical protein